MCIFDMIFLKDFLANLLATFFGVIFGIPAALCVDRFVRERQYRDQALSEKEQIFTMLQLLREELESAKAKLNYVQSQNVDLIASLELAIRLKDDIWQSFRLSGRLQLFKSPDLLSVISTAYASISALVYVGRAYFANPDLIRISGSSDFTPFFEGFVNGSISSSLESIDVALHKIELVNQG